VQQQQQQRGAGSSSNSSSWIYRVGSCAGTYSRCKEFSSAVDLSYHALRPASSQRLGTQQEGGQGWGSRGEGLLPRTEQAACVQFLIWACGSGLVLVTSAAQFARDS
jgi:hypothetical protein